jgi:hypothetical protein
MINWILIDDVIYHWDGGETISCQTSSGFSSLLPGSSLEGLEIQDISGAMAGELFVDFSAETLSYRVADNTYVDQYVTYSINEEIYSHPVDKLTKLAGFSDLVDFGSENQDLWPDIAHESQIDIHINETSPLDIDFLLFSPAQSLDLLLSQSDIGNGEKSSINTSYSVLHDDLIGVTDNSIDPLDTLLASNAHYLG